MRSATRSSLGKRSISLRDISPSPSTSSVDSNKRLKSCPSLTTTLVAIIDSPNANKENIAPPQEEVDLLSTPSRSLRSQRSIRNFSARRRANSTASSDVFDASFDSFVTPPPTPMHDDDLSSEHGLGDRIPAPQFSPVKNASRQLDAMSLAPSLHARARALLRSTTESFGVVGRAKERKFITEFLQPFVDGTSSLRRKSEDTTLYISGSPGTGKTALVSSIVSGMTGDDVRTAYINCMGLKDINVLWGRVLPALGETSTSAKGKASTSNWNRFEKKLKEASFKCVLVLDELDAFGASALSTIFGLPARFPASLRIIAISNDLTQSINSPTLSIHRPSLTLAFTAYDAAEMQEIIRGRLALLCDDDEAVRHDEKATAAVIAKVIQPAALTLLVKKVSSQTGDIRHALEVLRRALDLAAPMTNILEDPIPPSPIGMKHVIDAVKRTPKNAVASASTGAFPSGPARPANALDNSIASLSLQARFVLIGILLARRRTAHDLPLDTLSASSSFSFSLPTPGSTPCTPTKPKMRRATSSFGSDAPLSPSKVYSLYSSILRASASAPLDPVSRNEYTDLLGVLETASLISVPTISSPSPTKLKRGPARKSASFGSGLSGSLKVREDAGSLVLIPGEDDVLRALLDSANGGVLDAEITKTWERETKRIEKAIASRAEAALAEPPVSRDELL